MRPRPNTTKRVFHLKGGTIGCFRRAARYAPVALCEIDAGFSRAPVALPPGPTSCAALMARRMGASEQHAVMAAGLAGGIGLCGGACGALGAAIWVAGINHEFECFAICGRKFDGVADHASHLRAGGCSKILEGLAYGSGGC